MTATRQTLRTPALGGELSDTAVVRNELSAILARADSLYPDEATPEGVTATLAAELHTLVESARDLLYALAGPGDGGSSIVGSLPAVLPPEVADLCFAGSLELKRSLRELSAPKHGDELVIVVESARRKLCRVVRAVLGAAADGTPESVAPGELESAFAVRRLYATFRRALRRPSDESPEAVLEAVRYAVGALAELFSSPAYADVRAQDRTVLRGLRERALEWARHDKSSQEGLRLLGDVWTCADLLRGINRRQELRGHDEALLVALSRAPHGDADWWARLQRLDGLDDELDELLARARRDAGSAASLEAILLRLAALSRPGCDECSGEN
jgi:hypothetical protein